MLWNNPFFILTITLGPSRISCHRRRKRRVRGGEQLPFLRIHIANNYFLEIGTSTQADFGCFFSLMFGPASVQFCEPKFQDTHWFETWNSLSNIAYVIVAIMCRRNFKIGTYTLWTILLIAFGSYLLHSTGTRYGQLIDEFGMLLWILNQIWNLDKNPARVFTTHYLSILVFIGYAFSGNFNIFLLLFLVCSLNAVWLFSRINSIRRELWSTLNVTSIALVLWTLEQTACGRFPAFKWFHPIWHGLTAMSVYKCHEMRYHSQLKSSTD